MHGVRERGACHGGFASRTAYCSFGALTFELQTLFSQIKSTGLVETVLKRAAARVSA